MEYVVLFVITTTAVTLSISRVLDVFNKVLDIQSKYLDNKKKKLELKTIAPTAQQEKNPPQDNRPRTNIVSKLFTSNFVSIIGLLFISYRLWVEYSSNEPITREAILSIAFLFSLGVFNTLSLIINQLNSKLNFWIDSFLEATGLIIDTLDANEKYLDSLKKQ